MRYELSDFEWSAIKPILPNKSSQPTIRHSSNSHQSECGCVAMSPRPRLIGLNALLLNLTPQWKQRRSPIEAANFVSIRLQCG
jgi:hypothetical protein